MGFKELDEQDIERYVEESFQDMPETPVTAELVKQLKEEFMTFWSNMNELNRMMMGYGEEKDDYDIFGEMLPASSVDLLKGKGEKSVKDCAWHEWRDYTGLTHVYQYCVKCDAKRDKAE